MFIRTMIDKIWYFNLILIVLLGSISYLALVRHTRETAMLRVRDQEMVLAKAQAANISSFFASFGNSLAVLAQSPSIESQSNISEKLMESFVTQWGDSGLIGEVIFINRAGLVIYNEGLLGADEIGMDVSDRDYFVWSKSAYEGEYYVGQPIVSRLGVTEGKAIVPVASPVFSGNEFIGVLASAVILDNLSDRYLEVMKVSESTRTILFDKEGNLIYGEMPDDYNDHVLSHQDIELVNRTWHIDVLTPIDEVEESMKPVYVRYLAIFVLVSLTSLLYVTLIERLKVNNQG